MNLEKQNDGKIVLIDEIHTPDSSRYFYADGYQQRQDKGDLPQKQLSKEFVRQWLIENGFQGKEGQILFQKCLMKKFLKFQNVTLNYMNKSQVIFIKAKTSNVLERIEKNVLLFLEKRFS